MSHQSLISYKKIDTYQWIFRDLLKIFYDPNLTIDSLNNSIDLIIKKLYERSIEFCDLLENNSKTPCHNKTFIKSLKKGPAGSNNMVGPLQLCENNKIRSIKSIQKNYPSQYGFEPLFKNLIFRNSLNQTHYHKEMDNNKGSIILSFLDPYTEIYINSILSSLSDLQISTSICKTYGLYLCNKRGSNYQYKNIIEKSSFTLYEYIQSILNYEFYRQYLNNLDIILCEVIYQLYFSLWNLKEWTGFIHFDLHLNNVMISNYGSKLFSSIYSVLPSLKHIKNYITDTKWNILYKNENITIIRPNYKFIIKIIDYGYSGLIGDISLQYNGILPKWIDIHTIMPNLGGKSGIINYNNIKHHNRDLEYQMSDFYFILCSIIHTLCYKINIDTNSYYYDINGIKTLSNLVKLLGHFNLDLNYIQNTLFNLMKSSISKSGMFYNRNIVQLVKNKKCVENFNQYIYSQIITMQDNKVVILDTLDIFKEDEELFILNLNPDVYFNLYKQKYNPMYKLISKYLSLCKKNNKKCNTLGNNSLIAYSPRKSNISKYVVTKEKYNLGFKNLRYAQEYLIQSIDNTYNLYNMIFLWNELLGVSKKSKITNRWFDGSFSDENIIYGTSIYVIAIKKQAKFSINIINQKLDQDINVNTKKDHNNIYINGNYFIVDGNIKNTLNSITRKFLNYPIGFYYKKDSIGNIMGTILQFPQELLDHYGVVYGYYYKNTQGQFVTNVKILSWNDFLEKHETINMKMRYKGSGNKIIECNIPTIKMTNGLAYGVDENPIIKKEYKKSFYYDFAFTTGPFLVKNNNIYFDDNILKTIMTYKGNCTSGIKIGEPITYNSQNIDSALFITLPNHIYNSSTAYGQKHSNWYMPMTILGITDVNTVKIFLIEGRGYDYPGVDRVEAAQLLQEKYGLKEAISLDGGFSSNALYFDKIDDEWKRVIDQYDDRIMGLTIKISPS